MAQTPRQSGKKNRKVGRAARKPKNAKYKNTNRRMWNKLKRIIQSNGRDYAKAWAVEYDCLGIYRQLVG